MSARAFWFLLAAVEALCSGANFLVLAAYRWNAWSWVNLTLGALFAVIAVVYLVAGLRTPRGVRR